MTSTFTLSTLKKGGTESEQKCLNEKTSQISCQKQFSVHRQHRLIRIFSRRTKLVQNPFWIWSWQGRLDLFSQAEQCAQHIHWQNVSDNTTRMHGCCFKVSDFIVCRANNRQNNEFNFLSIFVPHQPGCSSLTCKVPFTVTYMGEETFMLGANNHHERLIEKYGTGGAKWAPVRLLVRDVMLNMNHNDSTPFSRVFARPIQSRKLLMPLLKFICIPLSGRMIKRLGRCEGGVRTFALRGFLALECLCLLN